VLLESHEIFMSELSTASLVSTGTGRGSDV
jgi:hypothetical protein